MTKTITYPDEWENTHNHILFIFSEYGIEAIKDCKAICSKRNSNIVDCFNIFNSAVAAYNAGLVRKAELIYNFLVGQLKIYFPHYNFDIVLNSETNTTETTTTT